MNKIDILKYFNKRLFFKLYFVDSLVFLALPTSVNIVFIGAPFFRCHFSKELPTKYCVRSMWVFFLVFLLYLFSLPVFPFSPLLCLHSCFIPTLSASTNWLALDLDRLFQHIILYHKHVRSGFSVPRLSKVWMSLHSIRYRRHYLFIQIIYVCVVCVCVCVCVYKNIHLLSFFFFCM